MNMPLLSLDLRRRSRCRLVAAAGAPDRRAPGLHPSRPDTDRNRHLRDRPKRVSICGRGPSRVSLDGTMRRHCRSASASVGRASEISRQFSTASMSRRPGWAWESRRPTPDGPILIESGPGAGATVLMAKTLPHRPTPTRRRTGEDLGRSGQACPQGLLEELQQQNQELLNALQELRETPGGDRPDA